MKGKMSETKRCHRSICSRRWRWNSEAGAPSGTTLACRRSRWAPPFFTCGSIWALMNAADATKARAWLHLHLAMFDHAIRRSCQAAPSMLPADRKSFDSLMTTVGCRPNTRVYPVVDPALRATARHLLKTYRKFNPQFFTGSRKSSTTTDRQFAAVGED